jgi:DNA-directed RNA polymerase specialized sigma24 family protein
VILKDVYGLSCREIGEELDVEEGAVKVRLHRARKRLVELISEDDRGNEV